MMSQLSPTSVGIVIPSRNAAEHLKNLIPSLETDLLKLDIVVSDGGSKDESVETAQRYGARVTVEDGGRGPQLRKGVETVLGDWILLLHADSTLPPGWDAIIAAFTNSANNLERAAYFRFALDDTSPQADRLEKMVAWRCRTLGLPYGDQGLLISRSFLNDLGGVPDHPLMEDVSLVRKIGRRRLIGLDAKLVTSAEKFRRAGYLTRSSKNLFCLACYFLGVPPRIIRKIY